MTTLKGGSPNKAHVKLVLKGVVRFLAPKWWATNLEPADDHAARVRQNPNKHA